MREVEHFCDFLLNLLSKAVTRAGKQKPYVYETLIKESESSLDPNAPLFSNPE